LQRQPPYDLDADVLEREIEITVYKASGPGGQHRNKTESAVRIHHPPSGVTVVAAEHRSQLRNRRLAMERLIERLRRLNHRPRRRRKTRVPQAVVEERLRRKRRLGLKKKLRRPDPDEA